MSWVMDLVVVRVMKRGVTMWAVILRHTTNVARCGDDVGGPTRKVAKPH